MNYFDIFNLWKHNTFFDSKTRDELAALDEKLDTEEIKDRFCKELTYQKNGFTAPIGAGINRVNIYTLGKICAAYAQYLIGMYGNSECEDRGVVIGFGVRKNSLLYAKVIAKVFSGFGMKVYLQNTFSPPAMVSFLVTNLNAIAGVFISSSVPDKKFNGCRFFTDYGCEVEDIVISKINQTFSMISSYSNINFMGDDTLIEKIDYSKEYLSIISRQSLSNNYRAKADLKICYTSLCGLGNDFSVKALANDGFSTIAVVQEQSTTDGEFSNINSLLISDRKNFDLGLKLTEELNLDVLIANDIDCERVAVAVKEGARYIFLTSTQISVLILDYLIKKTDENYLSDSIVFTTIFTSNIIKKIAKRHNIECVECNDKFKFIGQYLAKLQKLKKENNFNTNCLCSFDETHGFLMGKYAKEPDGVLFSMLITEMLSEYKYLNKSVSNRLDDIYDDFGYYFETEEEFLYSKDNAKSVIREKMENLKNSTSTFFGCKEITDYSYLNALNNQDKCNMLKFELESGSFIVLKALPEKSKIIVYYSILEDNEKEAKNVQQRCHLTLRTKLEEN